MRIEPKTTKGKIIVVFVLTIIAIAPVSIVLLSGVAEFKWSIAWILAITFLLILLIAASLKVFGFDFRFTTKDQDRKIMNKLEPFFVIFEKIQNIIMVLVLVAIGYFYLKTKYGIQVQNKRLRLGRVFNAPV